MSEIAIRPARPTEYELIGELAAQAYVTAGLIENDDGYLPHLRAVADRVADAELLVAVDAEDTVLGTVTIARPGTPSAQVARAGELEFRMLATAPAAQGRGIGELLTRAVFDRAHELGLQRVVISVADDNVAAIRLYRRLGFRRLPDRDWRPVPQILLLGFGVDLD